MMSRTLPEATFVILTRAAAGGQHGAQGSGPVAQSLDRAVVQPYFTTHPVGTLYYVILLTWYGAEIIMFFRQLQWRREATRIGEPAFWAFFGLCVIAAVTMLVLAPSLAPAARIGHPAVAFAVGMVLLTAGVTVRLWSFWALGRYFTFTVRVSPTQPVVTAGPYRLLRHPGYAGGLLAMIGFGLLYGNWLSFIVITVLWVVIVRWRIRIEERALLEALGDRYRSYAAHRKRFIPFVW